MKSPRRLRSLLLWLLASVVITITFRMATTRPNNHQPLNHSTYVSRVEGQPSAHLVEAALRKAEFPQALGASERAALHQPILTPNGITLIPDHSLLVEAIPVVEDPNLTWDPCLALNGGSGGTQTGAWTFNELMLNAAGPGATTAQAEQILMNVLGDLGKPVTIGSITAKPRANAVEFFDSWPLDPNVNDVCTDPLAKFGSTVPPGRCLSLAAAPVHLNAIVNRVDIGQNGQSDDAGQLRFVFGVTMNPTNGGNGENGTGCQDSGNQLFNIILEYAVPSTFTAQTWAQAWLNLSNDCPNGFNSPTCNAQGGQPDDFNHDLNQIIQQVVAAGAGGPNAPNQSALADLRTNENELQEANGFWELRQFVFQGSTGIGNPLVETGLNQTPDLSYDFADNDCVDSNQTPPCVTGILKSEVETLVNGYQSQIEKGTFNLAQVAPAVEAVSAINLTTAWDSSPSMSGNTSLYTARAIFAGSPQFLNSQTHGADPVGGIDGTCNGCHGTETQTAFREIQNRQATGSNDTPSQLSGFLVGCDNGGAILTVACPERTTGCGVSQNGTACVFPLNTPGTEIIADPVYNPGNNNSFNNTFADIQRRVNCMSTILNNSGSVCCDGAGNLGTHCN